MRCVCDVCTMGMRFEFVHRRLNIIYSVYGSCHRATRPFKDYNKELLN